jgi:LmbE family N-acetylglucosaminyl deacetylase
VTERVLCVITHPDDETMLTGGMLAMLAQSHAELHVLSATRGEGGELGEPPIVDREHLGAAREQELRCAAKVLGVRSVRFLPYVDPLVGENATLYAYTDRTEELTRLIANAIAELRPTMLLTHGSGGEYGHPGHALTHRGVLQAHALAREAGLTPSLYTFCAAIPGHQDRIFNMGDPADVVLDATPWLSTKAAAAACHRTQHGLFYRNHPEARTLLQVVRKLESLRRVWPTQGPHPEVIAPHANREGAQWR